MFGWLRKKPKSEQISDQILESSKTCIEVFKRTWREVNPPAKTPEQLAFEIELFSGDAFSFMFKTYPIFKQAPPFTIWIIVFTAILEADTHPIDLVNKAIDLLRAKYAN